MKESLEKLIRKVILKKYQWLKDFVVKEDKRGRYNFYVVRYYIDDDLYNDRDRNKINVIKSETKNLYTVLGPDRYDILEGVMFFSHKGLKMEESLKKLIGKVILPKYDWIKDFNVTGTKDGVQNLYNVHYYVDDYLYNEDDRVEINRIKSDTKNLYNSLEPSEYDFLNDLSFSSYED
jgi:hypothetical protein